jgi:outer membrane lipoprotein SlyB
MKKFAFATLLALTASGAWAQTNSQGPQPGPTKRIGVLCDDCGTVQEVKKEKRKGEGGAVGIIGGAVVGGLLGSQVGKGSGKTAATAVGAVGGGIAGNEVQKHATSKVVWVTKVRLKDGSMRSFEQDTEPQWRTGTILKVHGNVLTRP